MRFIQEGRAKHALSLQDHEAKEGIMYLAIAVETHKNQKQNYRIWFLELDHTKKVVNIGMKTKQELLANIFENYRRFGKTNWRAFGKNNETSHPIELTDFSSLNLHENTHFGNLPTLKEFQQVLDSLSLNLEIKSIA